MPGVIGLILQLLTVIVMATSIARERERGTLEQLAVTPLSAAEIFIGKLIPYFVLALLDTVNAMILARLLFGVSLAGHYPVVITLLVVFVLGSLGIGQLISTVSKNQGQAVLLAVFYIMPAFVLSGAFTPDRDPARVRAPASRCLSRSPTSATASARRCCARRRFEDVRGRPARPGRLRGAHVRRLDPAAAHPAGRTLRASVVRTGSVPGDTETARRARPECAMEGAMHARASLVLLLAALVAAVAAAPAAAKKMAAPTCSGQFAIAQSGTANVPASVLRLVSIDATGVTVRDPVRDRGQPGRKRTRHGVEVPGPLASLRRCAEGRARCPRVDGALYDAERCPAHPGSRTAR